MEGRERKVYNQISSNEMRDIMAMKVEQQKAQPVKIESVISDLKTELNKKTPSSEKVSGLFSQVLKYDLDKLVEADKKHGGQLMKTLNESAIKFKKLADISSARFRAAKDELDKIRESDPKKYAKKRIELLKELNLNKSSEKSNLEVQAATAEIIGSPAAKEVNKGMTQEDYDKMTKWLQYGGISAIWVKTLFPTISKVVTVEVPKLGIAISEEYLPAAGRMASKTWTKAVEYSRNLDLKLGIPAAWEAVKNVGGKSTFKLFAVSTGWTIALIAAEPVAKAGVNAVERAQDKMMDRVEYGLKVVDVAKYETRYRVNERELHALVKDITLDKFVSKFEEHAKLSGKEGDLAKEIVQFMKEVPEEDKPSWAAALYGAEVKAGNNAYSLDYLTKIDDKIKEILQK